MRRLARGFTLIELMMVVAIIGILASVALPMYQDYTIRAKVSEIVIAASGFRTSVAEKAMSNNDLSSAGSGLTLAVSGRVSGGSVADNGVITIQGNALATSVGMAISIILSPAMDSGKVLWQCRTTDATLFKFVPAECRHSA